MPTLALILAKTEASAIYNRIWNNKTAGNIDSACLVKQNFVFGITAKSKNETGIAGLFDNGKFVPEGSVNLRLGGVVAGLEKCVQTVNEMCVLRLHHGLDRQNNQYKKARNDDTSGLRIFG